MTIRLDASLPASVADDLAALIQKGGPPLDRLVLALYHHFSRRSEWADVDLESQSLCRWRMG